MDGAPIGWLEAHLEAAGDVEGLLLLAAIVDGRLALDGDEGRTAAVLRLLKNQESSPLLAPKAPSFPEVGARNAPAAAEVLSGAFAVGVAESHSVLAAADRFVGDHDGVALVLADRRSLQCRYSWVTGDPFGCFGDPFATWSLASRGDPRPRAR